MERELQKIIDEKIHVLQDLENDLINLTGDYFSAAPYLSKIYHAILLQQQIDKLIHNKENAEVI